MKNAILPSVFVLISKSLTRLVLALAFFAFAALPQPAAAQGNPINIQNNGADAIRVCMYDARKVSIDPFVCLKIGPLTSTVWDRKQATFKFHMKVFKDYGSVAALACERKDLSNATGFNINWPCSIRFWNATPKPTPKPAPTPQPPPSWEIPPVAERDPRIKVVNQMSETVKMCVYRGTQVVIPEVCWTLKPKEHAFWDRKGDGSDVGVGLFKPGIIDWPFCESGSIKTFKGIPELVTIDPGCLLTARDRAPAKPTPVGPPPSGPTPLPGPERKVSIRTCNRNTDQTVNFVIAYLIDADRTDGDLNVVVEGWFHAAPGECQDIDMVPRFKQWGGPRWAKAAASAYQFLIYGETGGILNTTWGGEGEDPAYCIKLKGNFIYKQGTAKKRQCLGTNHERVQMKLMKNRDDSGYMSTFYFNF